MSDRIISTHSAPAAIGPYSQGVRAGDLVFLSGQIPLDPATMSVVEGGIRQQAEQVMKNMSAVAAAAGGSLDDSVKLTIFLTDLGDFTVVNDVMAEFFQAPFPARSTVQVAALPRGVAIEIEAVLFLPG